jgi:hypothetical protein
MSTNLLACFDRLSYCEIERLAYMQGDTLAARLWGDQEDTTNEAELLEEERDELNKSLESLQLTHAEALEQITATLADLKKAVEWINSDKCQTIERGREALRRVLATINTRHNADTESQP